MANSEKPPYKFVDLNRWPHPHTHAIGQITLEWNQLEREFERLVWLYLETDQPTARIVIAALGNQDKSKLLERLVELKEFVPEITGAIAYAIALFHVCRENRNHIAHSIAQPADVSHRISLRKPRRKNPLEDHELTLDINEVRECANEIRRAYNYVKALRTQVSIVLTDRQLNPQSVGDDDLQTQPISIKLPRRPAKPRSLEALLEIVPDDRKFP